MPEISRFFGIVIAMYYGDHAPPHFHVRYGGQKALVAIESSTPQGPLVAESTRPHQGVG